MVAEANVNVGEWAGLLGLLIGSAENPRQARQSGFYEDLKRIPVHFLLKTTILVILIYQYIKHRSITCFLLGLFQFTWIRQPPTPCILLF